MTVPDWIRIADGEMGQAEVPGASHNLRIVRYARDIGCTWVESDEVPWCAGFVGACLQRAGLEHTGSMLARSYLNWGVECGPVPHAVVVLRRGNDPRAGHVGFLVERRDGKVYLLGGNQGNAVSIAAYMEADVLGYRWPADAAAPVLAVEERTAAPLPEPPPAPAPVADAKGKRSAGQLMLQSGLGVVVLWLQSALQVALDAARIATEFAPVKGLLASIGGNLDAIGAGIGVSGVLLAIYRRLKDEEAR
jgi:uncharacterized protein (TIGR02594 family)